MLLEVKSGPLVVCDRQTRLEDDSLCGPTRLFESAYRVIAQPISVDGFELERCLEDSIALDRCALLRGALEPINEGLMLRLALRQHLSGGCDGAVERLQCLVESHDF